MVNITCRTLNYRRAPKYKKYCTYGIRKCIHCLHTWKQKQDSRLKFITTRQLTILHLQHSGNHVTPIFLSSWGDTRIWLGGLYFVWLVAILWLFFATVGYDLYSWALLLCPYFAAFDCLSSFKDGTSELYRPPSGKKKTRHPKLRPRHDGRPYYHQNHYRATMPTHFTSKIRKEISRYDPKWPPHYNGCHFVTKTKMVIIPHLCTQS